MTDEKIKEEFEKFVDEPCIESMKTFLACLPKNLYTASEALPFYAGFKAAERLAKIEVLEYFEKRIIIDGLSTRSIADEIATMLYELKEGE